MSTPRLLISSLVIERLREINYSSSGELLGVRCEDDSLAVLGLCVINARKDNPVGKDDTESSRGESYDYDIVPHLPANLNPVGVFGVSVNFDENEFEQKFYETFSKLPQLTQSLFLIADPSANTIIAKLMKDGTFEKVDYEVPNKTYWEKFIHFRVIAKLHTSCEFDCKSGEKAFTSLRDMINKDLAIHIKGSDVYLFENGVDGTGVNDKATVQDLKSSANPENHYLDNRVLVCDLLLKNDTSEFDAAPVITHDKNEFKLTWIEVPIDALSIVDVNTNVSKLHGIILESVKRNLKLSEMWMMKSIIDSLPNKISESDIRHFFSEKIGHFITIADPKKMEEKWKKTIRRIFHEMLSLPLNRQFFREGNEYTFQKSVGPGNILTNPHEGLNPSGVVNGTVSLVQGKYDYYHYMQDGIDDKGWGCAYRSLQTIISWFRYQGFFNNPIPSHKKIQECLVKCGDKPKSFIGSKNWIGSLEVGYVLQNLLGSDIRILDVKSGDEMAMMGGELSYHFITQGSPVMIGGGVLAHTILGVDYDRKTGDIKFLVLDPHYTGEEDLSIVQGKGWCGWKGVDFWKKGHFYNMCLPVMPKDLNY